MTTVTSDMKKNSNTTKTIKGGSTQSIITLLLGLIEIAVFSIMSHLLTKEDFGYYSALTAITTIFASFSETGIGSAIIQKKDPSKQYVDTAFTMCFLIGAFLMILLLCLAYPLSIAVADASLKIPLMIMSVTLLCNCLTSINNSLMYKKLQFMHVGAIKLVSVTMSGIIAIILAANGFGFYAILSQAVLISILTFLLSYIVSGAKYHFTLVRKTMKEIWSFSGWLMASVLFRNMGQQIDNLMMPRLMSVEILGAYNRPRSFIEKISTKVNSIFDITLFPILSGLQSDIMAMRRAFDKVLFVMGLVGTSLSVLFFFNAELLVRIFLGEKWLSLTPLFQVFSIAIIFKVYGRLADCLLRSLAMTKQQFYFRIVEFVSKFPAIIIGAKWGLYGIAIAVVLIDIILRIIKISYVARKIDYSIANVLNGIAVSNKFLLFILPPILIMYFLLPQNVIGNLIMLLVSILIYSLVFLCFPSMIGSIYKEIIWNVLINKIRRK